MTTPLLIARRLGYGRSEGSEVSDLRALGPLLCTGIALVAAVRSAQRYRPEFDMVEWTSALITASLVREVSFVASMVLGYFSIRFWRDPASHRLAYFAAGTATLGVLANLLVMRIYWFINTQWAFSAHAGLDLLPVSQDLHAASGSLLWAIPLAAGAAWIVEVSRKVRPARTASFSEFLFVGVLLLAAAATTTWNTSIARHASGPDLFVAPRLVERGPVFWPAEFPHCKHAVRVIDAQFVAGTLDETANQ